MSSLTTHYSLILNDGTDPFARADFLANWNAIDSQMYSNAQLAQQALTTAQAAGGGGGSGATNLDRGFMKGASGNLNRSIAPNSSSWVNVMTPFTLNEAHQVSGIFIATISAFTNTGQDITADPYIDSTGASGLHNGGFQNKLTVVTTTRVQLITSFGPMSLAAGAHNWWVKVAVGTGSATPKIETFRAHLWAEYGAL